MQLEDEIKKTYMKVLQPAMAEVLEFKENIEFAGEVAKNIGQEVKQSAQDYGQYLKETPAKQAIAESGAELAKGLAAGTYGSVGDAEGLIRAVVNLVTTPEGQSKLENFLKGFEENIAKSTADAESDIEKITGETPKGLGYVEGVGQLLAPTTLVTKGPKIVTRAVKKLREKKAK